MHSSQTNGQTGPETGKFCQWFKSIGLKLARKKAQQKEEKTMMIIIVKFITFRKKINQEICNCIFKLAVQIHWTESSRGEKHKKKKERKKYDDDRDLIVSKKN